MQMEWAETGRQQRPRREAPGGSRRGRCPGPRSPVPLVQARRPAPLLRTRKEPHTWNQPPFPGPSLHWGRRANRHPETWRRGFREWSPDLPAWSRGHRSGEVAGPRTRQSGRESPAGHRRGSGSQGLSPQEPLLGEDLRGPLGSWQGEGTSLLRLAQELPPARRFPAVCGLLAPPPHAAHPPHPGLHEAAARREAHHSAPSPGPALGAGVLRQGTGVRFSVSGAHGQEPVPSVGRHGSRGEDGESDAPSSSPACPPGADPSSSR